MTDHLTENARLRAALEAAKRDTALALAQVDRLLTLTTTLATERDDSREYAVALEAELKARTLIATPAPDAVQEAARVLLAACPNPLFDRLKPIIMGEVTESIGYTDEDGDERSYKRPVSWTAMKEIIGLALRAIVGDRT